MIAFLWERITGRPYLTTRSATAEFGPPPGYVHREALRHYTDAELMSRERDGILAEIRAQQKAVDALLDYARTAEPEPARDRVVALVAAVLAVPVLDQGAIETGLGVLAVLFVLAAVVTTRRRAPGRRTRRGGGGRR